MRNSVGGTSRLTAALGDNRLTRGVKASCMTPVLSWLLRTLSNLDAKLCACRYRESSFPLG
jgi:hypothetical protein